MSFNILAIAQAGRLEHEAILLAASLRHSDPGFPGTLFIAEPQPGPKWQDDPRISDRTRKRLTALGGDELRVAPPQLFVNGEVRSEKGYQRVMAGTFDEPKDGYRGYSNRIGSPLGGRFNHLGEPFKTYTVPEKRFWAMGDNSYQSSDSRDWGSVPGKNLMGTGVFVYWPFSRAKDEATGRGGRFGIIE